MSKIGDIPDDVLQFISRRIDSVPHLEALLLLFSNPSQGWTDETVAARIYVSRERAGEVLLELSRHGLIVSSQNVPPSYTFDSSWDEAKIMPRIAATYQRHLVYVASLIHSKPSSEAVKQFAKAFQFTKKV